MTTLAIFSLFFSRRILCSQIVHSLQEFDLGQSFCFWHLILCIHSIDTLNICMKIFDIEKIMFWDESIWNLSVASLFFYTWFYVLRSCICSAQTENRCNSKMVMRKVRILTLLCIHIVDTLNICMNAFDTDKITLTKWQAKVNAESLFTLKDFKNVKNEIHKIYSFLVYQFY